MTYFLTINIAISSALMVLTARFEMELGIFPSLESPNFCCEYMIHNKVSDDPEDLLFFSKEMLYVSVIARQLVLLS
jgi:hypothetical protein